MSLTSTIFVIFVALIAVIYYIVPEKRRWLVLLCASYLFYAYASVRAFLYLVPTTIEVFLFAKWIYRINARYDEKITASGAAIGKAEKKALREQCKKEKKRILALSLVLTFGVLCVLKYTNFICMNVASLVSVFVPGAHFDAISFFVPLGLSFYTFSAAGYLFDVYNNKYAAETSLPRFALFMSFFPSIIQGPINRNNSLRAEFFEKEHPFSLVNTQFALQRIFWGFLKKLVIADRAEIIVSYIFDGYVNFPWFVILFGLFMYAIELYADFSGGMDIALGVAELFGIRLAENFRQPYFATSVGDFWRRWHITLGAWMKDYVFYPFSLSKPMTNLSKKLSAKSRHLARVVPACLGNIIIFLLVGIWHGAEWHYVFWGLYQGGVIAISTLLEPLYEKLIAVFHVNVKSLGWKIFRIVRTFLIILIGYIVDEISDMSQVVGMAKQLFTVKNAHLLSNFSPNVLSIAIVLSFSAVWFAVSLYKEATGECIRQKIATFPLVIRWGLYIALVLSVPYFEAKYSAGFMYANF